MGNHLSQALDDVNRCGENAVRVENTSVKSKELPAVLARIEKVNE